MALNQNQLVEIAVQGMMDLKFGGPVISCVVYGSESSALIPGQAVKMRDTANGVPIVTAVAADTDDVFGFVVYNQKDQSYAAGDMVEIACFRNGVMYMTASAAIARNAKVMVVVSGSKVALATSGKTIVGRALDKATNNGDLIRVFVDLPGVAA